MRLTRRTLLTVATAACAAAPPAWADDPRKAERSFGKPDAKVTVNEYFSLTCTHCAAFSQNTMPSVTKDLIDTGKVRFVYHDFPLDQIALLAAQVARALPPDRYEPFVTALFASQDRWAFARGINYTDELWKFAALAGMSRATFDSAVADNDLKAWIVQQQADDQKKYGIDSTPTFLINGEKYAGDMSYDAFVKLIPAA
jgi:protein-disulfide isomerase